MLKYRNFQQNTKFCENFKLKTGYKLKYYKVLNHTELIEDSTP